MQLLKLCALLLSAVVIGAHASSSVRIQQDTRKVRLHTLGRSVIFRSSAGAVLQINLKEQYAKITETLKFKNSGSGSLSVLTVCQLASLGAHEASYTVRSRWPVLSTRRQANTVFIVRRSSKTGLS